MNKRQDGFVSIIMALVIMIFVTLIALGFAFLARQNQQQNQNRLLSTQAFYAAESAVNDAVNFFTTSLNGNGTINPVRTTSCSTGLPSGPATTVGSTNTYVKYTCVLYDTAPTTLERTVGTNQSEILRIQSQNGQPIQSVTISWKDAQGQRAFAANNGYWLPQTAYSGAPGNAGNGANLATQTGVLRDTLIPFFGSTSRADLTTKTQTAFLYPKANNTANVVASQPFIGSVSVSDQNQGVFVDGNCNANSTPYFCNMTFTGLNSPLSSTSTYYLRLRGLYRSSSVIVSASTSGNANVPLINDQAVVDATGKANNVLRRIQVRVPLQISANRPEFAIESIDSLCKLLQVWPGGLQVAPITGFAGGTPEACRPN